MEKENIFVGKTYEEAVNEALLTLAPLTRDELKIEVLEEGKKKLFGSTKWKIRVEEKESDADRAAGYIVGLLKIMGIESECEASFEDDAIKIDVKTRDSSRVIGKRGDVLDAIQCIAGAFANIGREKYVKVVVDCENYRIQREETLNALALKVAKKAVETGRKVTLEPMNPYERRIIHSALIGNGEVKTVSEGREPVRYVSVIPNNMKPGERPLRYGEKSDRREHSRRDGGRRFERNDRRERGGRKDDNGANASAAKRGKKGIIFGTYLGNSADKADDSENTENKTEE